MAAFTKLDEADLDRFLAAGGFKKYDELRVIEGGSVNSNFRIRVDGAPYFLRLYEEQDMEGAGRELATVEKLARRGVPTPTALGAIRQLAGRPAALFPWVEGRIRCQRSVSVDDAHCIGRSLAHLHVAGQSIEATEGRFHPAALRTRLERCSDVDFPVRRLRSTLDALEARRNTPLPHGLVHGDLFRDNVLWDGATVLALLDFESASAGAFIYDLAVTMLAWCFGDDFAPALVGSLVRGYESVRVLDGAEREGVHVEACLAAVRFTITRITDYAMRPALPDDRRVMKDWRRFLARLDALEAMGAVGLRGLTGLS